MPHSIRDSTSTQTKQSRPTSAHSLSAPPRQAAGATRSTEHAAEHSASPSRFSFTSSPRSDPPADHVEATPQRPVTRGTIGDNKHGQLRSRNSRSRQQFYDDSFSYKEGFASTARERVLKDAPIVAELRTNVIIKDEYTLVTDLSHHLSTRYQRPESSIMITVNHSACLLFGGSFEPTYVITISALPVQMQPTTNKRNAALMQNFMAESIGVLPDRGVVKFVPIPEDSLAINGMTVLGDIERLERQHADENGTTTTTTKRTATKSSRKSAIAKAKSSIQLSRSNSKTNPRQRSVVTPPLVGDGPLDSGVAVNEKGMSDLTPAAPMERPKTAKNPEPLLAKFSKRNDSTPNLVPPPIPDEKPASRGVSKRKSFLSVFRR